MLLTRLLVVICVFLFVFQTKANVLCLEIFFSTKNPIENVLSPFEERLAEHLSKVGVFDIYQKHHEGYNPIVNALARLSDLKIETRNQYIDGFVRKENFSEELKGSFTRQAYLYRYVFYGFAVLGDIGRHLSDVVPSVLELRKNRGGIFKSLEIQREKQVLENLEKLILYEIDFIATPFNKMLERIDSPSPDLVLLAKLEAAQLNNIHFDLKASPYGHGPMTKVQYIDILQQADFEDGKTPVGQLEIFRTSLVSKIKKKELYSDQN